MTGLSSQELCVQQYLKANKSKPHQKYQQCTHNAMNVPSVKQHSYTSSEPTKLGDSEHWQQSWAVQGKGKNSVGLWHIPFLQRNVISVELLSWIKFSTVQPGLQEPYKSYLGNRLSFRLCQLIRACTLCNTGRWDCPQVSSPILEITFLPHSCQQNTMYVAESWWKPFSIGGPATYTWLIGKLRSA